MFIILEYVYMAIVTAYTDMYSIVPITNVYISYSEELHIQYLTVRGSFVVRRIDNRGVYEIYFVGKCEIDHLTMHYGVYTGAMIEEKCQKV
jgi:hypothetical protein